MKFLSRKYLPWYLLFFIVLLSRVPFLFAGYGVEEDSWGIALAAFHRHLTGIYEPSRFPGHPVHEWIYSAFWGHSPFFYNFFSAFFSALAAVVFAMMLKHLKFRFPFIAALALAFTPVVYISSTYTIDFTWSLAFMLTGFYLLLKEQYILCGIILGLAVGCRITMGAMLLPFLFIIWNKKDLLKNILKISVPFAVTVLLVFLPLIRQFGASFFMYYDQFPYPPVTKVLYKMSIGVFGVIGTVMLVLCTFLYFFKRSRLPGRSFAEPLNKKIIAASLLVIALFIISYFRLPQKSGYMITVIPFVIILAGYYLSAKWFVALCFSLILSSFIFSINLTDKLRGSEYSRFALKFRISGQELFFDPLRGPMFSDYSKRKQKMKYTDSVNVAAAEIKRKTAVISGWWYNEIMVETNDWKGRNENVVFVPYIDSLQMFHYIEQGFLIKYLPEQNIYNDQMFRMTATDRLSLPFEVPD